jgi:hypothetical protein
MGRLDGSLSNPLWPTVRALACQGVTVGDYDGDCLVQSAHRKRLGIGFQFVVKVSRSRRFQSSLATIRDL